MAQDLKLPLDKFVVGQYIWWSADRYFSGWSVPGIITEVNLECESFTVRTFDDFKETCLKITCADDERSEFSISSREAAEQFLREKISELRKQLIDLEDKQFKINKSITRSLAALEL